MLPRFSFSLNSVVNLVLALGEVGVVCISFNVPSRDWLHPTIAGTEISDTSQSPHNVNLDWGEDRTLGDTRDLGMEVQLVIMSHWSIASQCYYSTSDRNSHITIYTFHSGINSSEIMHFIGGTDALHGSSYTWVSTRPQIECYF